MSTIRITSGDGSWGAELPRVFTIGRDASSDIVGVDPTMSRRHAEIRPAGDGWELVDLGSAVGTWVAGQRVQRMPLVGTTSVGFGAEGRALHLEVTVARPEAAAPARSAPPTQHGFGPPVPTAPYAAGPSGQLPPAQPEPPVQQPPRFQASYPPAARPPSPLDSPTMVTNGPLIPGLGPGLLVRRRVGTDLRFPPGMPLRVGRDPALEVVADDTAVSRLHATIEPGPAGWRWTDRSTSGTYVDGERQTSFLIEEPTEISLGHPTAGYELEVVPVVAAGEASRTIKRRKVRRGLLRAGAVAAVLVLIVGVVLSVVLGGDDPAPTAEDGLTDGELNRAKAASVLLTAYDGSDQPIYNGSGSIISDDGLILTNAHVGDPDAPGQGGGEGLAPDHITVALTSAADDVPAAEAYRAETIVSDGYLDIAVMQIVADADGNPVDPGDLELPAPMPLGDSDELRTGDDLVALGFPAIGNPSAMGDQPLTVTTGVVSTFQANPIIGTERGFIDSDVRLGSGNSGGASINDDGELVGLNTAVITAATDVAGATTGGSALIVPVRLADAVLEVAYDGGDPDYVSPFLDSLPEISDTPGEVQVTSAGWTTDAEGNECSPEGDAGALPGVTPGDTVFAQFSVAGLPDGAPFALDFLGPDGETISTLSDNWTFGTAQTCVGAPFAVTAETPSLTAVFLVGEEGQEAARNEVSFQ